MKVGFIGVGQMGAGMAANLVKAGHELTAYNRSVEKTQALAHLGARVVQDVREISKADVVITMLAHDAAVESMVFGEQGVLTHARPGTIHISMSTISVALATRLAEAHAKAEQRFVAAPVFGRPDAAADAKLFIVAAGARDTVQECEPLFSALGQKLFYLSDQPSAANLVKLSGNFLIAAVIESLGEAMALIAKAGIDRSEYLEILTSTLFTGPVYKNYGKLIAEEKFEPAGFAAPLGYKDIRLAIAAAEELHVPMPLASLLHDRFVTLLAQRGERLDWSAIATLSLKDAGA